MEELIQRWMYDRAGNGRSRLWRVIGKTMSTQRFWRKMERILSWTMKRSDSVWVVFAGHDGGSKERGVERWGGKGEQ